MAVYTIGTMLVFIFFFANIFSSDRNQISKHRLKQCYIAADYTSIIAMFFFVFLLISLESIESNGDMNLYFNAYNRYSNYTFAYFFEHWFDYKSPFYHICSMVFSKVFHVGFYWWHYFIAAFYAFSLTNLINKNSSNQYISYIAFFALGQFGFALSGIRQAIAISIIMCSFSFAKKKKFFKFLILIIIASQFHMTALIAIVIYFLYNLKFSTKNIIAIISGSVIAMIFAPKFSTLYIKLMNSEEYYSQYFESDTVLTWSGTIISFSILIFALICFATCKEKMQDKSLCYFAIVSLAMSILSVTLFAEMFRIAIYFSLFDIIMIPRACTCNNKNKNLVRLKTLGVTFVLVLYYFVSPNVNIVNYVFKNII